MFKERSTFDSKFAMGKWKIIFLVLITFISQSISSDVMFIVLTEKDNVQNPFVDAFEQAISKAQKDTSSTANTLTFDHKLVVFDRY